MKCPECGKDFPEAVRGSVDGDGVYRLRDENSRMFDGHACKAAERKSSRCTF